MDPAAAASEDFDTGYQWHQYNTSGDDTDIDLLNSTLGLWNMTLNMTSSPSPGNGTVETEVGFFVKNIRLLKVFVLGIVVVILMLSTCKFVLRAFSRFNDSDRKEDI